MSKTFQRKIEDFTCEHCAAEVSGNGYTNHCPECLWSKHVDVYPGDREATCEGMMKPIEVIHQGKDVLVLHKCEGCEYVKKNKLSRSDNMETVIGIVRAIAEKP